MPNALARIVRHLTARIDYLAFYPARVIAQSPAGTLDVVPEDARLPELSDVPIRIGVPGVSVRVKKDSRVLIGFEAGNRMRPVAVVWDASSVESVVVVADKVVLGDKDGARPVARVGDPIEAMLPPVIPVTGTLNGMPFAGMLTIVDVLVGIISAGAEKTQAA